VLDWRTDVYGRGRIFVRSVVGGIGRGVVLFKASVRLGAVGYQLRSGDARCEGFYQSPVSEGASSLSR